MPTFEFVEAFVKQNFERVKSRRQRINCRCIFCGDSKKSEKKARFNLTYYSPDSIIYHCFNCEKSGSFTKLYSIVKKISIDQAKIDLGLSTFNSFKENIEKQPEPEKKSQEFHNYILADCFSEDSDDQGQSARIYIKVLKDFREKRHISPSVKLYIAYKGKYAKRIIIPVFDEHDNIIYFQGRAMSSNIEPKYLNPIAEKSEIIPKFHILEAPVVITEGLLDSEMLGVHGTSCLGASISEDLISKLRDKDLIIALDNDSAGYASMKTFIEENKYSGTVKYFLMPQEYKEIKDLNQLKIENPDINILEFVVKNSYTKLQAQVLLKFNTWRK